MASLKDMRDRIGSVKATQKITKAMQMVAAAKLRRAQDAATGARPYATRMAAVIANLAAGVSGADAPAAAGRHGLGSAPPDRGGHRRPRAGGRASTRHRSCGARAHQRPDPRGPRRPHRRRGQEGRAIRCAACSGTG
jgi:hypothetical protein